MSGPQFEDHLVFFAEINRLNVTAAAQVPNVQIMAIFAVEEFVGLQAVLDHIGSAPFAGDHGIMAEMPPEIVGQTLGAAIHFPLAKHIKALVIEQKHAARTIALR